MGQPLHRQHYSQDSPRLCQHGATKAGTSSSKVENQSLERTSPTSTTRWKGQLTQPTLFAVYCESQGKYHSIYTQRNVLYTVYVYTQSLFCLKYSCNVHSNRKTYSQQQQKEKKEFSTFCKLYKFTYICIFDNGKLYKLMNIQHSCIYSLISIPIYV